MYVLILSASADQAARAAGTLERSGYTIETAVTLADATAALTGSPCTAAVLIGLAPADVPRHADALREASPAHLPIIASATTPARARAMLEAGADDVFDPRSPASLLSRLAVVERSADSRDQIANAADAIFSLSPDGHFTGVNAEAERLTGYPRGELLGMHFSRLATEEYLESLGARLGEKLAQLPAKGQQAGFISLEIVRADGERIPVEITTSPVFRRGRAAALQGIARDLRPRRQLERAVAFRAEFLDRVDAAAHAVDTEGRILYWNAAAERLFGYSAAEALGRRIRDVILPDSERPASDGHVARLVSGNPLSGEFLLRKKDGTDFLAQIAATPLAGPDGAVTAVVAITFDLTERRAQEERLAHYQAIIESSSDAVIEHDLEGRIVYWNAAAERIYGYRAEEVLGRHLRRLAPEEDRDEIDRGRQRVLAGRPYAGRARRLHRDGTLLTLNLSFFPVYGPDGAVQGTCTVARDLTAQALAEQERIRSLESASRLAQIIESANEAIVSSDADGLIVYANPAVERLFGFSPGEVLGNGWLETVPPDLRERDTAAIRLAIDGALPAGFVTQRLRRDGSIADVHVSSVSLRDAEGNFTGSASFVSDITERVRQERAAADRSADVEAIFTNASEGIVLLDKTFHVRTFNQAARQLILRLHNGEIREGDPVLRWVLPEDHAEFTLDLERALGGRTFSFARTVVGGGGDYWWEFSFSPIVLPDGSVRGVAIRMRDITEVKRTGDALVQAQKAESLAVLAGGIAHDFNNLLVGILLNASLVLNDLPPGSPGRKTIQAIETSGQRAADLARQMLAYSGKGSFVIRNTGLNPVVKEMTELLHSSIGKGITLDLDLDPALPRIEADVTQLRQVIMNLVVNASDAIGAGEGIIRISTRPVQMTKLTLRQVYLAPGLKPGRYVSLEVSDTGSGMDRETLARIFDPFFTTKFTGRGLGLAAVLGIMRGHKGAIKVESTPGKGATFRLLFPAVAAREEQPVVRVTAPASAVAGTVLIVDDEPAVRAVTARALRTFGLDVIEAEDGVAGLEAFAAQGSRISCVLLDLTMPRMGGEETFAAIRDLDPDVPVLLMSGFSEDEGRQRFDGLGIAAFIEKPFALATLRSAIQGAIDLRRSRPSHC